MLRDSGGGYLGCAYLYPMGRRTELSEELVDHDVDVSWWVTADAYDRGLLRAGVRGLRRWMTEDFPFADPYWSNRELPAPDVAGRTAAGRCPRLSSRSRAS